ncbi:MAG: glycosyltransferase family 2 protein [Geminicoccaceae bacterium]|nr:glycosyltransferase family 2 protein [Geminicoccaceae bacterium]
MATVIAAQQRRSDYERLAAPELAVIVPTYNERANLAELARRISAALDGVAFEVVIVDDDSPDGTAELARELARHDPRFRCLQRVGRRGLASACVEGMLATCAPYLAVIDADLQHDELLLPRMLERLQSGHADLVVASRYLDGSVVPGWSEDRRLLSRLGTALVQRLPRLRGLSDPLSGFFAISRPALEGTVRRLSAIGFKLLLDILLSAPVPLRVVELPYRFRSRRFGSSKLDARVAVEFLLLLADKALGGVVPARFLLFAAVGATGVLVHLAFLVTSLEVLGTSFMTAQTLATVAAMVFNFALNNELTWADRRLRGLAWLRGLASFVLVCGLGAIANVGVAAALYARDTAWPLAAAGGILVGAVWNYVVSGFYTWGERSGR